MNRRGVTMVELLVALVLLTVVMVATATWTRIATTGTRDHLDPMTETAACDAVRRLIETDLLTGDFETDRAQNRRSQNRRSPPRVVVENDRLSITTRSPAGESPAGPVVRIYEWDRPTRALRQRTSDPQRRHPALIRPLLTEVTEWTCRLDEEDDTLLHVTLATTHATRSWRITLP